MAKLSKRMRAILEKKKITQPVPISDAVNFLKETSSVKFEESIDVSIKLSIDPKKSDQNVRGSVVLPHGTGKDAKVLALVTPDKEEEAKEAGADFVGLEEFIEKIKGGWTDVDVIITMPSVMGKIGALGKVLGPRGLMPNPKSGTVSNDVGKAVADVKKGKIDFKVDATGIVHAAIGKASFDAQKLTENSEELIQTIVKLRPSSSKGTYIKSISISSTMGIGVSVSTNTYQKN